jgi:DNA-binding NtrC family response regulator
MDQLNTALIPKPIGWTLPVQADGILLGNSPSMRRISRHLERASEVQCTVLITGETGTGKEVLARMLHRAGPRANKPFIPVNCAALSPSLAESQLFGHERGSFTGAAGSSLGVFRAAANGIVFLDEIGEMPLELQAKLLRVLQEGELTPVGASIPVKIEAQIIAATNRQLEAEVAKKNFREDLFYRLNMVELRLPALRERSDDIPGFIQYFSRKYAERYQRAEWTPSTEIVEQFCLYDWPGNIRQLAHTIEQAYVLEVEPQLPQSSSTAVLPSSNRLPYLNLEKLRSEALRQALLLTRGHKGRAAELLGVHANTLTRMIAEAKPAKLRDECR